MLIEPGEKIHVIMRRAFESQVRRHFAGEVVAANGIKVRATGYVFVYDDRAAKYERKELKRTTIFDLGESGYIVNVIPRTIDLEEVRYQSIDRGELFFTHGKGYRLNINEFGIRR